jgi:hypothetical protein
LSELAKKGFQGDLPLLRPAHPHLPCGRLVLFRAGACTPKEMVRLVSGLNGKQPGLCPDDFEFSAEEVNEVFGGDVVIYRPVAP